MFNGRMSEPSDIDAAVAGVLRAFGRALLWVDSAVDRLASGLQDLVEEVGQDRPRCSASTAARPVGSGSSWPVRRPRWSRRRSPTSSTQCVPITGPPRGRHRHPDRTARHGVDGPTCSRGPAPRRAQVVGVPRPDPRATAETTYVEASAANRTTTDVGLSIQTFRLVPKILDVDRYVRSPIVPGRRGAPRGQLRAMDATSVVPAKPTADGATARATALRAAASSRRRTSAARGTPPTTCSTRVRLRGRRRGRPPARRPSRTRRRSSPTGCPRRSGCEAG